jgi:hypothetical protein
MQSVTDQILLIFTNSHENLNQFLPKFLEVYREFIPVIHKNHLLLTDLQNCSIKSKI